MLGLCLSSLVNPIMTLVVLGMAKSIASSFEKLFCSLGATCISIKGQSVTESFNSPMY